MCLANSCVWYLDADGSGCGWVWLLPGKSGEVCNGGLQFQRETPVPDPDRDPDSEMATG